MRGDDPAAESNWSCRTVFGFTAPASCPPCRCHGKRNPTGVVPAHRQAPARIRAAAVLTSGRAPELDLAYDDDFQTDEDSAQTGETVSTRLLPSVLRVFALRAFGPGAARCASRSARATRHA